MKCLIVVNPNSDACFISDLFEGTISDADIFGQCRILQEINTGDSLLVDKGLTIQHFLLTKQTAILIPPFLGKRDAFTKEKVMLTKWIAKRVIPFNLCPIASQMVYVASCLVKFQECLCVLYSTRKKMLWSKDSATFITHFFLMVQCYIPWKCQKTSLVFKWKNRTLLS